MPDQELLDQLFDVGLQVQLKALAYQSKFKSIKDIKVFRKKVKKKKWIFTYTTNVRVIKFIVDEPQYVMESLMDDLSLKDFITPYSAEKDDVLEIYDEYGNEVA